MSLLLGKYSGAGPSRMLGPTFPVSILFMHWHINNLVHKHRMEETELVLNRLLRDAPAPEDLKYIEAKACCRLLKPRLATLLISNKTRVLDVFSRATCVDQQVSLVRVLHKALSKKQITESCLFGSFTSDFAGLGRAGKNDIRAFILKYSGSIQQGVPDGVIGCRILGLRSRFKELALGEGLLFLNSDCMKIFVENEAVVIYYRSILAVTLLAEHTWTIRAHGDKVVDIRFANTPEYGAVEKRVMCTFGSHMETEESMSLSIEDGDARPKLCSSGGAIESEKTIITRSSRVSFDIDRNTSHAIEKDASEDATSTCEEELAGNSTRDKHHDYSEYNGVDNADSVDNVGGVDNMDGVNNTNGNINIASNSNSNNVDTMDNENTTGMHNSTDSKAHYKKSHNREGDGQKCRMNKSVPLGHGPVSQSAPRPIKAKKSRRVKVKHYKTPRTKNKSTSTQFFHRERCLGDAALAKIEAIYKATLKYNNAAHKKMNEDAKRRRAKMMSMAKMKIHLLNKI